MKTQRRILVLVNDRTLEDFVCACLGGHDVNIVQSPQALLSVLRHHRFELVIVTNFGVGPWDAVAAVPTVRGYPVLFLTGYWDKELERICAQKAIGVRRVPVELPTLLTELRLALDDPSLTVG